MLIEELDAAKRDGAGLPGVNYPDRPASIILTGAVGR
jgi:hypothetical protein